MEYTIHQLAGLAGVTRRALRHYDQIGLLRPARVTQAGYRIYGPEQVDRLQQILFYRELGLELSAVRDALDDPAFDRAQALRGHLAELEARRARLDRLILTVRKTLNAKQGGSDMTDQEKFECFKRNMIQENEARYGAETRERYGDEAVDGANGRIAGLTQEEYGTWKALGEQLQARLEQAVRAGADPAGEEGRALAGIHRSWLSYSWQSYSPQAHMGLAALYTQDERFSACYDRSVPGCAAFLRAAVEAHAAAL